MSESAAIDKTDFQDLAKQAETSGTYTYILDKFLESHKELSYPKDFVLVAVEGPDGCGKTTLSKHLYGFLVNRHVPARYIKDSRASELDDVIYDTLSFAYMRSVTMNGLIMHFRNNSSKTIIIYDRYIYSNVVYQLLSNFYHDKLDKKKIGSLLNCIISSSYFIKPNIIIYLNEVLDERKRHQRYAIHKKAFNDIIQRLEKEEGLTIWRPSCTFKVDDLGELLVKQLVSQ